MNNPSSAEGEIPSSNPAEAVIGREKRSHPRFPVWIDAEAIDPATKARATGQITDPGPGGYFVETPDSFPVGSELQQFLEFETSEFHCHALVTHTVSGNKGMGVTFLALSPEGGISVLDWLGRVGRGDL